MITKKENAKNQIARLEYRIENFENDYLKIQENIQNLLENGTQESRAISNLIKLMSALQDEIGVSRSMIEIYRKSLEEKK
jgi:septation ring formation regulator EzrA